MCARNIRRMMRLGILLFVLFFAVLLCSISVYGWNGYANDDRNTGAYTGDIPSENVTSDWVYWGNFSGSSPAVANGTVYVGGFTNQYWKQAVSMTNGEYVPKQTRNFYAMNSSTGEIIWRSSTQGSHWSSPEYEDGVVYVGSLSDKLYAFDAKSGEVIWEFEADNPVFSPPTVSNERVYFGERDYTAHQLSEEGFSFYSVNVTKGDVVWKKTMDQGVFGAAATANQAVYVGDQNGTLHSLNVTDGKTIWEFDSRGNPKKEDPAMRNGMFLSPAIKNGTVYTASYNGIIYAVNTTTGRERWNTSTSGLIASSPAVANGKVYIGNYQGDFVAMDMGSGSIEWKSKVSEGRISKSSPAVTDTTVVFGSIDGKLYGLNSSDGSLKWSYNATYPILSSPAVTDSQIYFANIVGTYALSESGSRKNISEMDKYLSISSSKDRDDKRYNTDGGRLDREGPPPFPTSDSPMPRNSGLLWGITIVFVSALVIFIK